MGDDRVINTRLTSGGLRMTAMAAMLVDHIGALVLSYVLESQKASGNISIDTYIAYNICRCMGRIAMPIFAYLLTEGFLHTSDRKIYAVRLCALALISEIPFDLAVSHRFYDPGYQNVVLTLFISYVMLVGISKVEGRFRIPIPEIILTASAVLACHLLKTDYAILAPALVAEFYLLRDRRHPRFMLAAITVIILGNGVTKFFGLVPIAIIYFFYDGRKGWSNRYLNYLFYPAHLMVLYAACMLII